MPNLEELTEREAKLKSLIHESIECHRAFDAQIAIAERDADLERMEVIKKASRRAQDAVISEMQTLKFAR